MKRRRRKGESRIGCQTITPTPMTIAMVMVVYVVVKVTTRQWNPVNVWRAWWNARGMWAGGGDGEDEIGTVVVTRVALVAKVVVLVLERSDLFRNFVWMGCCR